MLTLIVILPIMAVGFYASLYKGSCIRKKSVNSQVAEAHLQVPTINPNEVNQLNFRIKLTEFLRNHYPDMKNWQPDSWNNIITKSWFFVRVINPENSFYVKIMRVGNDEYHFALPSSTVQTEKPEEKVAQVFTIENWIKEYADKILRKETENKKNGKYSILIPNSWLPNNEEQIAQVADYLLQTNRYEGCEMDVNGIYLIMKEDN